MRERPRLARGRSEHPAAPPDPWVHPVPAGEPPATGGGLLRGVLSARGPRGFHPLGHRLLLFGRHRTALPRRCGVGRGLRYRGGDSRRPLRGGAPSRGLRPARRRHRPTRVMAARTGAGRGPERAASAAKLVDGGRRGEGRTARLPPALRPPPHLLTTLPVPAGGGRRGRRRPALRRPWSNNSPAAAGGGPTRGRPRRSRGGGDELGGRGQLRRREVHERLDAAVRSALRTRPRREQVRKGLRRPVRSSSQSSSSLLGVSGSWSPTCIAGICGRSPARRRAGAASRRTGERRTATTGGRRSGFRRCRE